MCGNSLGGAIASKIAFEVPELVKQCIPVCSTAYLNEGKNPLYEEYWAGHNPFWVENKAQYQEYVTRIFHQEMKPIPLISATLRTEMIERRQWLQKVLFDLETFIVEGESN